MHISHSVEKGQVLHLHNEMIYFVLMHYYLIFHLYLTCYTSFLIWWRSLSCIGLLSRLNFLLWFCTVWSYLPWLITIITNYWWIWWFLALCQAWTRTIVISSCICLFVVIRWRVFAMMCNFSPLWLVIRKMMRLSSVKKFFYNGSRVNFLLSLFHILLRDT
jgi:hypothetical protein